MKIRLVNRWAKYRNMDLLIGRYSVGFDLRWRTIQGMGPTRYWRLSTPRWHRRWWESGEVVAPWERRAP